MTWWALFIGLDFTLAVVVAFVSGWIFGRQRGHAAGFKAGLAWGQRLVGRYRDEEPTRAERRR